MKGPPYRLLASIGGQWGLVLRAYCVLTARRLFMFEGLLFMLSYPVGYANKYRDKNYKLGIKLVN